MPGKVCSRCKIWTPADGFWSDSSRVDGLHGWCKACHKAHEATRNFNPDPAVEAKLCNRCSLDRPITDFSLNKRNTDGYQDWCKECQKAEWATREYVADPLLAFKMCNTCGTEQSVGEFSKSRRTKDGYVTQCRSCIRFRRYNVTAGWYQDTVEAQGGGCGICGEIDVTLSVDHDHTCCSGNWACGMCVRGALCTRCNTGLGSFRDDPVRLTRAIEYLAEHEPWKGGG